LGKTTTTAEKRIEVDLTTQTVKAYEGDKLYFETKTSTGKWGRTPTGEFTIWVKLRATRMSGGEGADFYDLPNVPYVMFFSNDEVAASRGFSLHGAYWHNNFGHPMSHGCVNLRPIDAKVLYDWVNPQDETDTVYANSENPGTKIIITGEAAL
jgi:lipoprotein-anchoring transpeptidase ErfK/SrfK